MATYKTGLIAKNQQHLKHKKWYNQRFDGCLNLIWMISEAEIKAEPRKMKGGNFTSHLCIFEDHKADWYIDRDDIKRVTDLFLKKAQSAGHFGRGLLRKWHADEKSFALYVDALNRRSLRTLSDAELSEAYHKLAGLYEKTLTSSSLIDGFALGSDEIVQGQINTLLDIRKISQDRGSIFSILTAPVHQSFINAAEISLLRLALRAKMSGGIAALKKPAMRALLAAHAGRYFWINNNYHDNHVLTAAHFSKEVRELLSGRINLAREIKKIKDTPHRNILAKRVLIRKLRPRAFFAESFRDFRGLHALAR